MFVAPQRTESEKLFPSLRVSALRDQRNGQSWLWRQRWATGTWSWRISGEGPSAGCAQQLPVHYPPHFGSLGIKW